MPRILTATSAGLLSLLVFLPLPGRGQDKKPGDKKPDDKKVEKKLDPKHFIRIHRSTVVNLSWIKEVALLPGGALQVRLKDRKDTSLTVARDRAREFKLRLGC